MKRITILLMIVLLFTGCSTQAPLPTTTPLPTSSPTQAITPSPTLAITFTPVTLPPGREVVFSRLDGKDFTGTAYGEGDTLILLANMSIGGRKQWDPFVVAVDKEKFTTITFDYRSIEDPNPDMDAIFNWLRGEGYHRVICIGASMGTRVCSSVMSQPEMIGVALLAGAVHHASVAQAVYPKLFVSGEDDRWAFDIQEGYKKASDPRTLVIFENNRAHGTDLFKSQDAEAFLKTLLDFVNPLAIP